MAKPKKVFLDEVDLELLSALYYLKQATATDLEKEFRGDITKAGISKRLKWLVSAGYLEEPEIDISTGKLKKLYGSPDREKLKTALLEWYKREIYDPMIDDFLGKEVAEAMRREEPLEKAYERNKAVELGLLSPTDVSQLLEGVDIRRAREIFEGYSELASFELLGFVVVEGNRVKLTEKGLEAILNEWAERFEELRMLISGLKELGSKYERFREAYEKLRTELCGD